MELANPYSFNSLFNAANFEGATKTETILCETQQKGLLPARKKMLWQGTSISRRHHRCAQSAPGNDDALSFGDQETRPR